MTILHTERCTYIAVWFVFTQSGATRTTCSRSRHWIKRKGFWWSGKRIRNGAEMKRNYIKKKRSSRKRETNEREDKSNKHVNALLGATYLLIQREHVSGCKTGPWTRCGKLLLPPYWSAADLSVTREGKVGLWMVFGGSPVTKRNLPNHVISCLTWAIPWYVVESRLRRQHRHIFCLTTGQ